VPKPSGGGFDPPAIPPDRRDELADEAWEMWAAEGWGYRLIAQVFTHERGVPMSHVTAGVLVKEGKERARQEWPTRSDMALRIHTASMHLLEKAWQEWRAGGTKDGPTTVLDIAPHVGRELERLARLHGVNAPARLAVSDDREPVSVDDATVASVRAAAEVLGLLPADGEDPTP
jgi:hypothetical protein